MLSEVAADATMGTIYLARHGQTVHNAGRILQGPRLDGPLSELGVRQAQALAQALEGHPVTAVYTSPLLRARQTAEWVVEHRRTRRAGHERSPSDPTSAADPASPLDGFVLPGSLAPDRFIAAPLAHTADGTPAGTRPGSVNLRGHAESPITVQVVPELYEMDYGHLAGRPYDDVKDEVAQVLDAWQMGFPDQAFPGGESAVLAQHRVRPFAQRVLEQARRDPVLVVAHGRINRILLATWTGAGLGQLESFPQANASLNELAVDVGGARIVRVNDTAHLAGDNDTYA